MGGEFFYSLDGPLDTLPVGRQMRIAKLHGFPELLRDHGADPRAVLERHQIDPRLIRDAEHYVDSKLIVELLEDCSLSLNAPLLGLQLAQRQEPDVFGCVTALCRAAPTFREAIRCFIEYIPVVHSPTAILELVEGRKTAEFRWQVRGDLADNKQANYQAVSLDLKLFRQIGGSSFRPYYVNLATNVRSKDLAEVERQLGSSVQLNARENAIAFSVEWLDQPVVSANRLVFQLLGGYLERVTAAAERTFAERVHDYVRGALPHGHASIERCAKKLGISVRTLQARLSEVNMKFMDIREQHRIDLAKVYLRDKFVSLDDIAARLGYAEQSSFGRAFKRWTGLSPKTYRENFALHE